MEQFAAAEADGGALGNFASSGCPTPAPPLTGGRRRIVDFHGEPCDEVAGEPLEHASDLCVRVAERVRCTDRWRVSNRVLNEIGRTWVQMAGLTSFQ